MPAKVAPLFLLYFSGSGGVYYHQLSFKSLCLHGPESVEVLFCVSDVLPGRFATESVGLLLGRGGGGGNLLAEPVNRFIAWLKSMHSICYSESFHREEKILRRFLRWMVLSSSFWMKFCCHCVFACRDGDSGRGTETCGFPVCFLFFFFFPPVAGL